MSLIALALDRCLQAGANISDCFYEWKVLEESSIPLLSQDVSLSSAAEWKRFPHNFLAHYLFLRLQDEWKFEAAMDLANELYPENVYLTIKCHAKTAPSKDCCWKHFSHCFLAALCQYLPSVRQ